MTLVRQGILWSEIIAIFRRGSGIGNAQAHHSPIPLPEDEGHYRPRTLWPIRLRGNGGASPGRSLK